MMRRVFFRTSGFLVCVSMVSDTYHEPYQGDVGWSEYLSAGTIQETVGRVPAATSFRKACKMSPLGTVSSCSLPASSVYFKTSRLWKSGSSLLVVKAFWKRFFS